MNVVVCWRRWRVCGRAVNGQHRLTWGDYDRIIYLLIPLMYSCKILFYYIYNKVLYISWVIEGKGGDYEIDNPFIIPHLVSFPEKVDSF